MGSKAGQVLGPPPHGRFHPLLWLHWFLHSIRRTGGVGPASSQTRASPAPYLDPDRDCNPPPPRSRQASSFPHSRWGQLSLLHFPWAHGQLGDRGPACSAAFRHLRSVFGASQDPRSMPPNVFDLFWRVLGANHFGAALVQTSPNSVSCRS